MSSLSAQLDHVFLFVKSRQQAEQMMREAGLEVNYSRSHPGQGTTNLCACLDDVFLELLWLDGSEISDVSKDITLTQRGQGNGSPLGIAWRGDCLLKTIPYAAPFLPDGMVIPVAEASLDPSLPFVFEAPGGARPVERADGLPGTRQTPRFTTLNCCRIELEDHQKTTDLLDGFSQIEVVAGGRNLIQIDLNGSNGEIAKSISWSFWCGI